MQPLIPTVCPNYVEGSATHTERRCRTADARGEVFFGEAMATFLFVLFVLLIVKLDLKKTIGNAAGVVVAFLLFFLASFTGSLGANLSSGTQNPTLLIELAVWGAGAYTFPVKDPVSGEAVSAWEYYHYGSYFWTYLLAQFTGAALAGLVALIHLAPDRA
jgi:glycerol uptake facilitator-like aquaporin